MNAICVQIWKISVSGEWDTIYCIYLWLQSFEYNNGNVLSVFIVLYFEPYGK